MYHPFSLKIAKQSWLFLLAPELALLISSLDDIQVSIGALETKIGRCLRWLKPQILVADPVFETPELGSWGIGTKASEVSAHRELT